MASFDTLIQLVWCLWKKFWMLWIGTHRCTVLGWPGWLLVMRLSVYVGRGPQRCDSHPLINIERQQAIRDFLLSFRELCASFRNVRAGSTLETVRKRFGTVRNGAKWCENVVKRFKMVRKRCQKIPKRRWKRFKTTCKSLEHTPNIIRFRMGPLLRIVLKFSY